LSTPRRHHYVPQVYLKRFCSEDKKLNKIYVYDKIQNKEYQSDISKIAVEKDFYRVSDKEDEFYWEKFYSENIETKYNEIIEKTVSLSVLTIKDAYILNKELKHDIAFILCTQLLRTKKSRKYFWKIGEKAAEGRLKEIKRDLKDIISKEKKDIIDKFKINGDLIKELGLDIINDDYRIEYFIEYLLDKTWVFYKNLISEDIPFITSDHPICLYNTYKKSVKLGDNGLALNATDILFPLNKKILLALYPKEQLFGELKKFDGKIQYIDEKGFIKKINRYQMLNCHRQIYSPVSFKFKEKIWY